MKPPVFVTVRFHSQPHKVAEMKTLLQEIISNTLSQEPGCVSYTYLQSIEDQTLFTSLEVWQDAASEEAHWKMPHLADSLKKLPDLISGEPDIRKWHRI